MLISDFFTIPTLVVSFDDFNGVSGQIVQFNKGDSNQTHIISINQDQHCEIEYFNSTITLISGIQPIEVIQPNATIFIDDSIEEEGSCGKRHMHRCVTMMCALRIVNKYLTV